MAIVSFGHFYIVTTSSIGSDGSLKSICLSRNMDTNHVSVLKLLLVWHLQSAANDLKSFRHS